MSISRRPRRGNLEATGTGDGGLHPVTEQSSVDGPDGHPDRWRILWILCGALALVVVSVASLNVALPEIQRALGATARDLQWIIDAYALVFAGLLLPAGAFGDRSGRRGALILGLVVFGLAAAGGAVASSPGALIAWRAVMGMGAAFIMPATLSIIATVFPADERARAIAIWAGFAGAGGAVGLVASGLLLETYSWVSVLWINIPLVAVMLAATLRWVPTSRDENAAPLDLIGSGLSIVALVAFVYGVIEGAEAGWAHPETVGALVLAAGAGVAFVAFERRHPNPMLDPTYFRIREFTIGSAVITVAFFGLFGMFFVMTQFFQFVQATSPLGAAMRILPYGLVLLVVSPVSVRVSARLGERTTMVAGLLTTAVGFGWLGMARPATSAAATVLAMVVVAIGVGLLMPPATTAIVVALPPGKAGVGSAMNDTTREIGGAVGIALLGALLSIGYRRAMGGVEGPVAEAARDSIGSLLSRIDELPAADADLLVAAAGEAFADGMRLAMFVAAGMLVAVAGLVAGRYPSDRGQEVHRG